MNIYEKYRKFETVLAGRPLVVETGKFAGLANGSCMVRYGDTAVLCCATASEKPRDGIDFFPLAVDFEEKLYSVGRIPGSYLKREGRPSEKSNSCFQSYRQTYSSSLPQGYEKRRCYQYLRYGC